jgi:hypothetical protein
MKTKKPTQAQRIAALEAEIVSLRAEVARMQSGAVVVYPVSDAPPPRFPAPIAVPLPHFVPSEPARRPSIIPLTTEIVIQ